MVRTTTLKTRPAVSGRKWSLGSLLNMTRGCKVSKFLTKGTLATWECGKVMMFTSSTRRVSTTIHLLSWGLGYGSTSCTLAVVALC